MLTKIFSVLSLLVFSMLSMSLQAEPVKSGATVLVVGANGRSGVELVKLLQAQNYRVIGGVRDLERGRNVLGKELELRQVDITDPAQIAAAAKGVDAVISAVGSNAVKNKAAPEKVDYQGVANLAIVGEQQQWKKLVLISSMGVTRENHFLNRIANNVLIWKFKGEEAVRASKVDYTIIRPGGLQDGKGGHFINMVATDRKEDEGMIDRADVARVVVAALSDPAASRKTLAITADKDKPAQPGLSEAFAAIPN